MQLHVMTTAMPATTCGKAKIGKREINGRWTSRSAGIHINPFKVSTWELKVSEPKLAALGLHSERR